jgi:hypothetical protein
MCFSAELKILGHRECQFHCHGYLSVTRAMMRLCVLCCTEGSGGSIDAEPVCVRFIAHSDLVFLKAYRL